jgi:hypothetical protein
VKWEPKTIRRESPKVSLSIEPYKVDFRKKGKPVPGIWLLDFSAGSLGILYFHDIAIKNNTGTDIALTLEEGGKYWGQLGPVIIPRLKADAGLAIRWRGSLHGNNIEIGLMELRDSIESVFPPSLKSDGTILCPGEGGYCEYGLDNMEYRKAINWATALPIIKQIPSHKRWRFTLGKDDWNIVDLEHHDNSPSTVPASRALDKAASLILREIRKTPSMMKQMSPASFETFVGAMLHEEGFQIEFSANGADGGIDLFALTGPEISQTLHIIQCKRYGRHKVGIRLVRELFGVRAATGASKAVLVTTSSFTAPACSFASEHPWELSLVDYEELLRHLLERT